MSSSLLKTVFVLSSTHSVWKQLTFFGVYICLRTFQVYGTGCTHLVCPELKFRRLSSHVDELPYDWVERVYTYNCMFLVTLLCRTLTVSLSSPRYLTSGLPRPRTSLFCRHGESVVLPCTRTHVWFLSPASPLSPYFHETIELNQRSKHKFTILSHGGATLFYT